MNKTETFSFDTPLEGGEEDGKGMLEVRSFEFYISVFHYKKITNWKKFSVKISLTGEKLFFLMKTKNDSIREEDLKDETEITRSN